MVSNSNIRRGFKKRGSLIPKPSFNPIPNLNPNRTQNSNPHQNPNLVFKRKLAQISNPTLNPNCTLITNLIPNPIKKYNLNPKTKNTTTANPKPQ